MTLRMRALRSMHALLVAAVSLTPLTPLAPMSRAEAQSGAPPTASGSSLFTPGDALLAAGVAAGVLLVRPLDDHFAARLQDSSTQANAKLHALATFVRTTAAPGAYYIGVSMYALGRLAGKEELAELGLHGTEALVLGDATAAVLKGIIGRQRPYVRPRNPHSYQFMRGFGGGDPYRSFPSGHSVAAFAAAAAVSSQTAGWWPDTRWIIGPALYGGAALAGVSRIYDNRHWASDVIAGAGIGTFAGLKVVRYHSAHPGNRLDRWLLSGSLVPNEAGGRSLHWSLLPDVAFNRGTR